MQFSGYMLDDTHAISVLYDTGGNSVWALFTFAKPLTDGKIGSDTEYTVTRVDPDNFILNGKRIHLIAEKEF